MDKKELGLTDNKKLVLCAFGSLGSSKMNEIVINSMSKFENKDYEVLFITGKDSYEELSKISVPSNVIMVPYIENTPRIMKQTDLFISRAGALFLSEIIALNLPSILVPSPYVPDNHQYKNAKELEDKDACVLIEKKDLTSDILVSSIDKLINDNKKGILSLDAGNVFEYFK